jgi:outer membrane biogenesis lipoprotein LolB
MRLFALLSILLLYGCASDQKKFASVPTAELKLRRQQLIEEIAQPQEWRFTGFRKGTQGHEDQIEEKEKIEMELLHRCQAGDKAACLPQFSR